MTKDFVWKMVPVGFFFFVILIWALAPSIWVSAFPPADEVAKHEVGNLGQVIPTLKELEVRKYTFHDYVAENRSMACQVLSYQRGNFTNDPTCVYESGLQYNSFDEQALADLHNIRELIQDVPEVQSIGRHACESDVCFYFSRKFDTLDWLRSFPDNYYYKPGYELPKRELNIEYYPIDDNWYYVHFGS